MTALTRPRETPQAPSPHLETVARRVRQLRARRGMSRRILAAASGVSERYLAQLEAGKGNPSILVLAAIAEAMNIALDLLLDPRADHPVEYLLLREQLRTLDAKALRHLCSHLRGAHGTAGNPGHVALIGLRGAGKSTLGAALAKRLGLPFVELVQEIERAAGLAVSEILARGGQQAYRRLERAALYASLARFDRAIIAVGGSLVSEPETYEHLLASCTTVWIKASPREHMERVIAQGDTRPMADNRHAMADLKRILDERAELYARAGFSVDTSRRTVDQTLTTLLELPPVRAIAAAA